jgi:hypothetical protein
MRGLVPRIHVFRAAAKAWMAGTSPAMTTSVSIRSKHAVVSFTAAEIMEAALSTVRTDWEHIAFRAAPFPVAIRSQLPYVSATTAGEVRSAAPHTRSAPSPRFLRGEG